MAAHLTGQIQAGIRLIHGVALRAGEVNKMAAVLQHLSTALAVHLLYLPNAPA